MASVKTLRRQGITVTDRLALLRAKFDSLSRKERTIAKSEMQVAIQPFLDRAYQALVANTPENAEGSDTMKYREAGWSKFGVQDYVLQRSPLKSERYFGISLRNAWAKPQIDFLGSGVNRIGLNARFASIAPQAPLVLLGEYKQDSWNIPKNDMHGGRRVMMWEGPDGRPMFRWMVVQGELRSPLTVYKPRRLLTQPLEAAQRELEASNPAMIKAVQESLQKEFESV